MNRKEVIRLVKEIAQSDSTLTALEGFERFAALVAAHVRETEFKPDWNTYQQGLADGAAAEREACAKLAQETVCDTHIPTGIKIYGSRVAKAIRARSNT